MIYSVFTPSGYALKTADKSLSESRVINISRNNKLILPFYRARRDDIIWNLQLKRILKTIATVVTWRQAVFLGFHRKTARHIIIIYLIIYIYLRCYRIARSIWDNTPCRLEFISMLRRRNAPTFEQKTLFNNILCMYKYLLISSEILGSRAIRPCKMVAASGQPDFCKNRLMRLETTHGNGKDRRTQFSCIYDKYRRKNNLFCLIYSLFLTQTHLQVYTIRGDEPYTKSYCIYVYECVYVKIYW